MSNQLKKPRNRYIDAYGAPVHAGFLRKAFHSAHARAAVLSSAFSSAALTATGHGDQVAGMLWITLLMPAYLAYSSRNSAKQQMTMARLDPKTLCIDRKPDAFTPPTPEDMMPKAEFMHRAGKAQSTITAVGVTLALGALGTLFMGNPAKQDASVSISLAALWLAYSGSILDSALRSRRFGKVVDGTFAIVDTPAPKKREKESKSLNPFAKPA